jgi:hypothetical protein
MITFITRLAIAFAALLIASVAFIGAICFLCYSVFLGFVSFIPGPLAAVATTVFLILFAMLILFMAARTMMRAAKPRTPEGATTNIAVETIQAMTGIDLADLATKNPYMATGLAFFVGLLFGVSPNLRRAAGDVLRR